jgi:hypothetical protein
MECRPDGRHSAFEHMVAGIRCALSSNRLIEIAEQHPHHCAEESKACDQAK